MIIKKKYFICATLIIVLTTCIFFTGCTSTQHSQTSAQSNSPTITTLEQTPKPTTIPETVITPNVQITVPTAIISTTGTSSNNFLTVTLNSAEKKPTLGNSFRQPGRVLLILDISIKNNDKSKVFEYKDTSFVLSIKSNNDSRTAITTQKALAKSLINPLISGTVQPNSEDDGKIVFHVNESSDSYKLSIVDSTGTVLTSIDNINVP
jgi:hypothetical protein